MKKEEKITNLEYLISESKNGFEKYKAHFKKLQENYLLQNDNKEYFKKRNKSDIFIPKLNSKVKYLITSLNDVYFNSERMADIESYINSDEEIITLWQKALDFYTGNLNLFKTFQPLFLDVLVVGTSIAKITWDKGFPKIDRIGIDEIFFDPNATNNEDISYIVNEIYLSYSQIEQRQKLGFYKKSDIDRKIDKSCEFKKNKLYDVYVKKDDDKWVVSTIFEGELLRDEIELIDGQPFVWGFMLPQLNTIDCDDFVCAYGEPVMASALPLQKEINITRNLIIDAMRSALNPKVVLPKSAGVSREDLETIGKPVYTADVSAFSTLPTPNINSASANLSFLETELTEVTGVSPQNNGAQTAKNETATEISIKAQEGGRRSADYIRSYNETFVEPLFDRLAKLVFKYGNDEFFNNFAREDIPSFRFNIQTGTGAMNKEVQRAGLQASMQALSQIFSMYMNVGDAQSAYKIIKINETLLKQLLPILGIKNINSLFGDENNEADLGN
ncbi:portal protein [Campylobacter armoricus]|uniref:Bacteriophage head to tail connecting protein n=1 Tax=Campylobacter armoricus TaxID=2505970 RepID=A0A7L5I9Y7_9BACT|nr:hypothetical protein [Campylobacter armoricus]QKF79553.1 bacteriophage head to tail connecting protein [Campylobacter armoricus]